MKKTSNYNLNQWEPQDRVTRADVNADNAAIDAALGAMPRLAMGTYRGNDATTHYIEFDFVPKFVWLNGDDHGCGGVVYRDGGIWVSHSSGEKGSVGYSLNGTTLRLDSTTASLDMNRNTRFYMYFAIG